MTSTDPAPEEDTTAPTTDPVVEAEAAAAPPDPVAEDLVPLPATSAGADAHAEVPDDAAAKAPAVPKPDLSPEATGARLSELFPALFVGPSGNGTWKPIKLRIHADIQARAPGQFSKRALGIFFSRYTTTTAYLRALAAPGAQRHDLDGEPAGEIAEEHRALAAEEVARRQAIVAERRAAQREAHLQAQREARKAAADQARAQAGPQAAPQTTADERPRRPPRERPGPRPSERAPHRPPEQSSARSPERPSSPRTARPVPAHGAERPPRARPHDDAPHHAARPPAAPPFEAAREDEDPARRERAALLRAFESSTLTKSNFCVLKRIDPKTLDEALETARKERADRGAPAGPPPRR